jgi:hypothetical protein
VNCVFCGESVDVVTVGFKACCSACGHYLHSCVQCSLFDRSSGRCTSLTTDSVRDLEGLNYCEEFRIRRNSSQEQSHEDTSDAADRFMNLFRNGEQEGD